MLKLLGTVWSNPHLLNPNVSVSRIDSIDFAALRKIGVKYLVFDKDNTLTAHLSDAYYDKQIENYMTKEVGTIYNLEKNVFIVSNSVKTKEQQAYYSSKLGLPLILTKTKKPQNFNEILTSIQAINSNPDQPSTPSIKSHEIAFFGDRLFTDVLLANMNGCVSVHTQYFSSQNESLGITFMRKIEQLVMNKFENQRRIHSEYSNPQFPGEDLQKLITKSK